MERRRQGRVRKRRINEVEADVYTEMKVNAMGFNWKKPKKQFGALLLLKLGPVCAIVPHL